MGKNKFTRNINLIKEIVAKHHLISSSDIRAIFNTLKEKRLISLAYSFDLFYKQLIELGLVEYTIAVGSTYFTKYSFDKEINVYEFVYSFKKNSFFSMSTSLNLQGYTNYRDNFIFISTELTDKTTYDHGNKNALLQEDIDNAFKKPYRRTHSVGKFGDKNIVLLSPKYTKRYSVIEKQWSMSSINRAFVEMIINVQYFRNSLEIIQTFIPIKTNIDIKEVFKVIKEFDLIYPYFQCAGYYLEKIGFSKDELAEFKNKVSELKFYTDKNQKKYQFDYYWNMYHIYN